MLYWFPLNPFKFKYQVVHEQKFKDLLSSICQVSVESRVLDLESEAPGSIPTGGNILSLAFFLFSRSKDENANIGISVRLWKTLLFRECCSLILCIQFRLRSL